MRCDCINAVDAMLANHNTRITLPIMFGADQTRRVMICTDQIETGRGKPKASAMFASFCPFCPFCGEPCGPAANQNSTGEA